MQSKLKVGYSSSLILLLVGVLIGFFIGIKYTSSRNQNISRIASSQMKVLESCQIANEALNNQGRSCVEAYKLLRSCISDRACNLNEESKKLQILETQRKNAEETLMKQSKVIETLLQELRN
jgi:hypothetical protein